ncbi:5'(3')-deoxyribonucleotidase [Aequitasia blattaphilus]|uniref:Uncharacterized protein n=1 Tax=Aequitasia blattaphilus TaxID=2949332 RepID=A0ABT1E8H1_9FIRM|nr:hypothetical protein [Aequitasia blattaphilus]MCP1101996.1 hypothetical protein [Aequitasia blattaphilus]MCR8614636.1 hypothetical protein [Aequitasia blattaphilus]
MEKRLFVDMDGTLAIFKPVDTLETLYEPGYFRNLEVHQNVVDAIREVINENPEIGVHILSSYLVDSPYALEEKNEWLDKYLPEVNHERRIFVPCGEEKKSVIPNLSESDYLLDDYTKNLMEWEPPAKGIKLLNGINHTRRTWVGSMVDFKETDLKKEIVSIVLNNKLLDKQPERGNKQDTRSQRQNILVPKI